MEVHQQIGKRVVAMVLLQLFNLLFDLYCVVSIKNGKIEIAENSQHGYIKVSDGLWFTSGINQSPSCQSKDLAKDILLDFAGYIARQTSCLLAAIGEQQHLATRIRKCPRLLTCRGLCVELRLYQIGERSFAFGLMIHDRGASVAYSLDATYRTTLESKSGSPVCTENSIRRRRSKRTA